MILRNLFIKPRFWITAVLVLVLAGLSCSLPLKLDRKQLSKSDNDAPVTVAPKTKDGASSTVEPNKQGGEAIVIKPDKKPLSVTLSEGEPAVPDETQAAAGALAPVPGEPLTPAEIDAILARLPVLPEQPDLQSEFKIAQQPIPPPRAGETITEPFPPEPDIVSQPEVESGPLQVLRFSPEGEIPIAPFISVTFNQPMVPLATLKSLSEADIPLKMTPSLPGTWRWLGTQTLTFEYDSTQIDRLPKATVYQLSVPAGTKSITGGVLEHSVEWSFSTPPPKILRKYPENIPQPLQPLIFIGFDQRIEPSAMLEAIRVTADGQPASLVLAESAEIEQNSQIQNLVENSLEGRWLVFKPASELPGDAQIEVVVEPGAPSAEGPLTTVETQSFSFHTYAPLRVTQHFCSWDAGPCQPLYPFTIRFNNPLDTETFQEDLVQIEPELPGANINVYGGTLEIQGASRGRTIYTVTISADLQDIFGQRLGREQKLTFNIGSAKPRLFGLESSFLTLDPVQRKPALSLYAINYQKLDVSIYAVQPTDWPAYQRFLQDYQKNEGAASPPGKQVFNDSQKVEAARDSLTEIQIDLSPYLHEGYGHFIVIARPPRALFQDKREIVWQTIKVWVQVTQIGLDAFTDQTDMVVWATSLQDGAPLENVTISAQPTGQRTHTGADGIAKLPIPENASFLTAAKGADQALLPHSTYFWGEDTWQIQPVSDELRWYVFDDRQMYRPGEEVHIKGWIRRIGGGKLGDVGLAGSGLQGVNYRLVSSQSNDLGQGSLAVNALGGFDLVLQLPEAVNLGNTQLALEATGNLGNLSGTTYIHNFQILEFRRPEFEVEARNETPGPYFAGGSATVAVDAKYYAGDPLPNAAVNWLVTTKPGQYSPPKWPDFTFGEWQPIWWWSFENGTADEEDSRTFTGVTGADGVHYLRLDFDAGKNRPYSVQAEATVMDVNRQAWSSSTNLLVHPADLYVGLRSDKYFVLRGTPFKIDLIVVDLDGNPAAGHPILVQAARMEWKLRNGEWQQIEADLQTCNVASGEASVSCVFDTPIGGQYKITALISDDKGRPNLSAITRWVSGAERPASRRIEQEDLTLIPDRETYQPGDTAQVLVQAPFTPAEGLLTVSRSGLLYTQRFQVSEGSATLEIPILEEHIPNLEIQVDLVDVTPRTDARGEVISDAPPRPAYATGNLSLDIPPLKRTLHLELQPAQRELAPGGETRVDLVLQDASGKPVADAEVAVIAVDEAILALSNYTLADPLSIFYSHRYSNLTSQYGRASLILADPQSLAEGGVVEESEVMATSVSLDKAAMPMEAPAPMAGALRQAEAPQPAIPMRSDFNPLALFAPVVNTDKDGRAQVPIRLPDNLTRYRLMAVAVDKAGNQFGSAESNLTARLPLMVRPSAPRFLNFGDQFELPVVLQNQTGEAVLVEVVVRAANLEFTDSPGRRVEVPAHDRVEVRFPAKTVMAGKAALQIAAVSGVYADAVTLELPVYTPATTEAFATYGVIDQGAVAQPLAAPQDVFTQFGGLEINTSSTALQALTDAVLYLVSYPYESSEQLASRILAVAALRDVLSAFQAEGLPSPQEMEAAVQRDLERLKGMQNADGGFPYWTRGWDSIPFHSIHVAHALQRAKMKGFDIPAGMQESVRPYLENIESYYPYWYSQNTRYTLSAYALYVRNLMGDADSQKALNLIQEASLENLSLDAIGWLWPVLIDAPGAYDTLEANRIRVNNSVVETAGAANFITSFDEENYLLLGSNRRSDALLLDALIQDNPQSDLIPKLVNGLLAHTQKGRWNNTQENLFVLLALDRYFNTFETQTPDFVARLWLGDAYIGEYAFQGRTTERRETQVPMSFLAELPWDASSLQTLVLSKDGDGRLYYRLGLRYAPLDLRQDPLDMGFVVQRVYEAVDDPEDVRQDEDGVWHIRAGARVRVSLTMVASSRRYHVALVDPLPAGFEIINPALAVSGSIPQDPNSRESRYGWWWGPWFDHQNLRDERAEAFTPLLWDGVYQYTYIARATTPGTFVAPPTKAEEMYSPEVFGRSGSDVVVVE